MGRFMEKVVPQETTVNEAASFYKKLYQCLEAIATDDYSAYEPPTLPPVSQIPSSAPTIEIHLDGQDASLPPAHDRKQSLASPSSAPHHKSTGEGRKGVDEKPTNRMLRIRLDELADGQGETGDIDDDRDELVGSDSPGEDHLDAGTESPSPTNSSIADNPTTPSPSLSPITDNPTISPAPVSPVPTQEVIVPEDKVEEAKQAAANAQQAADEAKNAAQTEGDTKAADAAQTAATAAQAAVDATSNAAAKAAMDGLLSGDGATMTSIVTQCLTREKYGIASVNENGTATINAFLFVEGSTYYKLKMTSPYLEIAKINRALPKAVTRSEFEGGGELIDFVLAFLVLSAIFLLVLALLQQVGYECFQSLFRCQRWFFNPRKYDYEGNTLDNVVGSFVSVGGGIPLSMGGQSPNVSPFITRRSSRKFAELELRKSHLVGSSGFQECTLEVEMSNLSNGRLKQMLSDHASSGSVTDDMDEILSVVPERLFRDPDLVEMPHLKSTSRVAVPVGSNPQAISDTGHPDEVEYSFEEFS